MQYPLAIVFTMAFFVFDIKFIIWRFFKIFNVEIV